MLLGERSVPGGGISSVYQPGDSVQYASIEREKQKRPEESARQMSFTPAGLSSLTAGIGNQTMLSI